MKHHSEWLRGSLGGEAGVKTAILKSRLMCTSLFVIKFVIDVVIVLDFDRKWSDKIVLTLF